MDSLIPKYVTAVLNKRQHNPAQQSQHSLHEWEQTSYGERQQKTRKEYISPLATKGR